MKLVTTLLSLTAFCACASSAWASPLSNQVTVQVLSNPIPEPASVAAFIAGLAVLGIARRRRA